MNLMDRLFATLKCQTEYTEYDILVFIITLTTKQREVRQDRHMSSMALFIAIQPTVPEIYAACAQM